MNAHFKRPGSLFVVVFLSLSLLGVANAQTGEAVGTVDLTVVECSSITSHGVITSIPADCVASGGNFTFYLRDDGTADYIQLLIPTPDGRGNINLNPGVYEVVEENTQTHFDLTVTAGETTQATFAFAAGYAPEDELVRLYITSLVCVNYEAASFISFDGPVPDECTQVGNDVFSLYMYGDGTDDFVQVTSAASGPAYIDVMPGSYEIVHEATQMKSDVVLNAGSDYSMAFTLPAPVDNGPPAQTPVPAKVTPPAAPVKALPNTGIGNDAGLGILLVSAAACTVLLAGAGLVRSKSA